MAQTSDSTPITGLTQSTSKLNSPDLFIISKKNETQFDSRSISYSTLTSSISTDILPLVPKQVIPNVIYDTNLPLTAKREDLAYSTNTVTKFYDDTQVKVQNLNNIKLDKNTTSKQYVAGNVQFNKSIQCPTASGSDLKEVVNVEYLNNRMTTTTIQLKEFWSNTSGGWYKLYSNGWLEQGGRQTTAADNNIQQIILYKKYRDAKYTINATPCGSDLGDNEHQGIYVKGNYKITQTGFYYKNDLIKGEIVMWETKGFAEGY